MKTLDPRLGVVICVLAVGVSDVARSEPISRNNMAAFCRGEVAGMYGTRPQYVLTGQIERDGNGLSISGTVDKGNEGIKRFKCRFDSRRNFINVMAMTSDTGSNSVGIPRISQSSNGAFRVTFPNNPCTIRYNRNGVMRDQTAHCSAAHRSRAATSVASYRREQNNVGAASGSRGLELISKPDGGVDVKFNNGCWISYDRRAQRGGHVGQCRDGQYRRADDAARDFVRQ